ncbi:unnamed protein product [Musa hybrid cultivar]
MSSLGDNGKGREELTDMAIGSLLDAYTEKYEQLNRRNPRGRDWEDVATIVSERCNKQKVCKSVEQCNNKNDNLKKVILKISGTALAGVGPYNVDPKVIALIAKEIAIANHSGLEVAVVIGGQNIFCGDTRIAATGIDRATTDQMGYAFPVSMLILICTIVKWLECCAIACWELRVVVQLGINILENFYLHMNYSIMASLMNAIMHQASLEKLGVEVRMQSTLMMQEIAEPYISPLFSTDTAASLRASEIHADVVLKGTTVDSIYNCHSRNSNGSAFEHISFRELVSRGFTAMDMTALNICEENSIPVVIFNLSEPGNVSKALNGDQIVILIDPSGRII